MFGLFKKSTPRITIVDDNVFINNANRNIGKASEIDFVFKLLQPIPEINVFENDQLIRCYKIETIRNNPDLTGQFLHSSIRVLANSSVMIDGIISKDDVTFPDWTDDKYEAVRLQPFCLSNRNESNIQLIGKGLFERGLHFSGTITPSSVRNVCICDKCNRSFTIQHFHAGFSDVQYFYSSDSAETLIVPYDAIDNLPVQLEEEINNSALKTVEANLPTPSKGTGAFKYYNSFKCPHCLSPYIDFEKYRVIRPGEYYGNVYINVTPRYWTVDTK